MTPQIYHEKQIKELCALHSLNNLFQDSNAFDKCDLDNICNMLSPSDWLNPHKSILGTGNYDINVIMAALTTKGCAVKWFDKRKDPCVIISDNVVGFILNIPSIYNIGPITLPVKRKHWIAIRKIGNIWYNLDSKLDKPDAIGKEEDLIKYLRVELQHKEKELFIVITQEIELSKHWCVENGPGSTNGPGHSSTNGPGSSTNGHGSSTNGPGPGSSTNGPGPGSSTNGPGSSTNVNSVLNNFEYIDEEIEIIDKWTPDTALKASHETL